uniref:Uncharacterized protein n=1 Tax=Romanomermis culicivorax TaxID=13658 RepID=A0A915J2I4_ROMCU
MIVRRLLHWWVQREKNVLSSVLCLISTILLAGALCEDQWLYLQNGRCTYSHLGLAQFYGRGTFQYWFNRRGNIPQSFPGSKKNVFYDGSKSRNEKSESNVFDNAFSYQILYTTGQRAITSCGAICLTSWLCILVHHFQRINAEEPDTVQTSVEDGFYLIFVATILSICAVFVNLLKSTLALRNRRRFSDMQSLLSRTYSRSLSVSRRHASNDYNGTAPPTALLPTPILLPLHSSDSARRQSRKQDTERMKDVLIPQLLNYLTPSEPESRVYDVDDQSSSLNVIIVSDSNPQDYLE